MILVTGASGFIGRHLVSELVRRGVRVRALVRRPEVVFGRPVETMTVGDLSGSVRWEAVLDGVDAVVHLAARAHRMRDHGLQGDSLYRTINVDATRDLAEAAARSGVRRFVFLSSAKVLGETTPATEAWSEATPPAPIDPYGRSKLAAEQALGEVSTLTGIEVTTLRPPVVYGPGVRATMFELFRLVDRGVPLPLGLVSNRRSFVFVGNLVDAIAVVLRAPSAAREIFHVCDGPPVGTADLVRAIGRALRRPVRLLPVPPQLLRRIGSAGDVIERLAGIDFPLNSDNVTRLVASFVLDDGKLRSLLDWHPPATMDAGLIATAAWYRMLRPRQATG